MSEPTRDPAHASEQRPAAGMRPDLRRRRSRSVAIALSLGALVLMFYLVTIFKLGPQILSRPM